MKAIFAGDTLFFLSALIGTAMFALQMLLSVLGAFDDENAFHEGALKWFSWQALSGFFMMLGWTSLACIHEIGLSKGVALGIGLVAACLSVYLLGLILRSAKKLESHGSIFKLEDALGSEAVVYQRISKENPGKVSININDMTYEIDAVIDQGEALSFTRVKIIAFRDKKTVIVQKI